MIIEWIMRKANGQDLHENKVKKQQKCASQHVE